MKRGIPVAWHGLNRMVTGWLVLLIVTVASPSINAEPVNADTGPTLLVMGDSLSAAYGIEREEGWVNLLAERLEGEVHVINASISGETTSGVCKGSLRLSDSGSRILFLLNWAATMGCAAYHPIKCRRT